MVTVDDTNVCLCFALATIPFAGPIDLERSSSRQRAGLGPVTKQLSPSETSGFDTFANKSSA